MDWPGPCFKRRFIDNNFILSIERNCFRRYETMDETWIHWPKTQQKARLFMASIFWDARGTLFIDYLEKDQTIV